jgi:endonuclease YncB( thermonuclease family)
MAENNLPDYQMKRRLHQKDSSPVSQPIQSKCAVVKYVIALACACFMPTGGQAGSSNATGVWTDSALFISASDGDTLKVNTERRGKVTLRLAAIDSPERGQAYWHSAKVHLVEFASQGELTVTCYKIDQYARHVCEVKRGGLDLGASLIKAGLAWHYKRFQREQAPPDWALYAKLEDIAKSERIGLWKDPNPMQPEECRKIRRAGEKCR